MREPRGTGAEAARAVERVLRAERDAEASLVRTREEVQAMLEAGREVARADVNRAMQRVTRWQQAHALALEQRLQGLRERAAAAAEARPLPDAATVTAAVEQVVGHLTGAVHGGGRDGAD
ncbi:MAG: hypothetical protein OEY03_05080 [Rhizobacter sp.]|nr:hypothetical protein [Rhizobacter sp.]